MEDDGIVAIYVYCPRNSISARLLTEALGATRLRAFTNRAKAGDLVVNWGNIYAPWAPARVLNPVLVHNKFEELRALSTAGVPVPKHMRGMPGQAGWLARTIHHQEARDLLAELEIGDYYTQYVPTLWECRIHSFGGHSIRAALKVPRTDNPHPRFRSWNAGWKFSFSQADRAQIPQSFRSVAHKAVAALGYDFGAVDIGMTRDGKPVVFEVNSAPGIEGETVQAYARAIAAAAG